MTTTPSLPTGNQARGRLFCVHNLSNKNPALGGILRTVIKAARIALVTPNTHAASIEICDLLS